MCEGVAYIVTVRGVSRGVGGVGHVSVVTVILSWDKMSCDYMYYKNICPLSLSKHTCTCIFTWQENVQIIWFQNDNAIHVHVS